jgi:hypothetical protein
VVRAQQKRKIAWGIEPSPFAKQKEKPITTTGGALTTALYGVPPGGGEAPGNTSQVSFDLCGDSVAWARAAQAKKGMSEQGDLLTGILAAHS